MGYRKCYKAIFYKNDSKKDSAKVNYAVNSLLCGKKYEKIDLWWLTGTPFTSEHNQPDLCQYAQKATNTLVASFSLKNDFIIML